MKKLVVFISALIFVLTILHFQLEAAESPSFVRYNVCIVCDDVILYTFSSFGNFLKAKITLEPNRYYAINVYMINQLPSNIPDKLSIILSK